VKPGSNTESLIQTAMFEVGKLTMNDFLIICGGTNGTDTNPSRNPFNNITDFIKGVSHTNVFLIKFPYRHDVPDYSHVNNKIKALNSKLLNLQKFSTMLI
jgi:hypothetical protein